MQFPLPILGTSCPLPDLILANVDEYVVSESVTSMLVVTTNKAKTSESKPKSVSEPLIEDIGIVVVGVSLGSCITTPLALGLVLSGVGIVIVVIVVAPSGFDF
nr:hypothetical protein [Tanacetum cinerariifolium]